MGDTRITIENELANTATKIPIINYLSTPVTAHNNDDSFNNSKNTSHNQT